MTQPYSDDVTALLDRLWPILRRKQIVAWAWLAAIVVLAGAAIVLLWPLAYRKWGMSAMVLLFAAIGFDATRRWLKRQNVALIMPFLAEAKGFTYDPFAVGFIDSLPRQILPKTKFNIANDLLTGTEGGRRFRMAKVTTTVGVKYNKIIFQGLVLDYAGPTDLPEMLLVDPDATAKWSLSINHLIRRPDPVMVNGRHLEVWCRTEETPPTLDVAVAALPGVVRGLDVQARLVLASITTSRIYLMIAHDRELFRFDGLAENREDLAGQIAKAVSDLDSPIRVLSALSETERRLSPT